jgi:tetratricopeptide (TPR) repeat protein
MGASLREIDNIRAAWRHVTAHGRLAEIHKCLYSLYSLYQGSGLFQEGEPVFAQAVEALRPGSGEEADEERVAAWGLALVMQGYFARWFARVAQAVKLTEEGLALLHQLGDRREVAVSHIVAVGTRAWQDPVRAEQLLEQSVVISRKLRFYPGIALAQVQLAVVALLHTAYSEAEEHAREALGVSRQIDDQRGAALAFAMLGHAAYGLGEYTRAKQCYEQGLTLFRETRQLWGVGRMYSHLGDLEMTVGNYEVARQYHQQALSRCQDEGFYWVEVSALLGGCWGIPISLHRLGDVALAKGDGQAARHCYWQSVQMAIDHPNVELQLYVLLGPARLLAQERHIQQAVELAALAKHHPASVEETRGKADALLDRLRPELPPEAYAAAESRGRARDLEGTLHELLVELGPAAGSEAILGTSGDVDTGRYSDG